MHRVHWLALCAVAFLGCDNDSMLDLDALRPETTVSLPDGSIFPDVGEPDGGPPPEEALYVEILDVGQGDSILLRTTDGHAALVDGGRKSQQVKDELQMRGVTSLDYVIATHADADHIGGLEEVVAYIDVGLYVDNGLPHTTQTYENLMNEVEEKGLPYHVAFLGDTFDLGDSTQLQVLSPMEEHLSDQNEASVVVRVLHAGNCFLLTGDAESSIEAKLVAGGVGRCGVLKTGHHGAGAATGDQLLEALQPSIALISVGDNNYGHPTSTVLERLQAHDVEIYRTDQLGTIELRSEQSGRLCIRHEADPNYQCSGGEVVVEPEPGELSIVEVFFDVEGGDNGFEWVKLYNSGEEPIDLEAYLLGYGGSSFSYGQLPLSGSLPAGECMVVGGPESAEHNGEPDYGLIVDFDPDLQNGGPEADAVGLFLSDTGVIEEGDLPVDVVLYGEANSNTLPGPSGASAEVSVASWDSGQSIRLVSGVWIAGAPAPSLCP